MLSVDVDGINERVAAIVAMREYREHEIEKLQREVKWWTQRWKYYRCLYLAPIITKMKKAAEFTGDSILSAYARQLESEYWDSYDASVAFEHVDDIHAEVRRCGKMLNSLIEDVKALIENGLGLRDEEVALIKARDWWLRASDELTSATDKARCQSEIEDGIATLIRDVQGFDEYVRKLQEPQLQPEPAS